MTHTLVDIQECHGIPDRLCFSEFDQGFLRAHLSTDHGACSISLYGGHLLEGSLSRNGQATNGQLFWLSPKAIYREGKAIRGGVPIVFPWFGSHPVEDSKPAHGFARLSYWKVVSASSDESQVSLVLGLDDDEFTRGYWDQGFSLRLTTKLSSEGLSQSLRIKNTGSERWTWAGGFHPYFSVASLDSTRLSGVTGIPFVDLTNGEQFKNSVEVDFGPEVDRAYATEHRLFEICQESSALVTVLECSGTDSVVVWNPGLGHEKSDMPEHSANEFVCVEPARSAHIKNWSERSILEAGESTVLSYRVYSRQE